MSRAAALFSVALVPSASGLDVIALDPTESPTRGVRASLAEPETHLQSAR